VIASRMTQPPSDPPEETPDDPEKSINIRLDPVHYAALLRISGVAHLKAPQALRHLIRIADRYIHGKESPFVDRLEAIFPKRKVG
jgi:hypothetical protein